MSFMETVRRARDLLREEGRITLRGLKREFDLDDDALEELVEELVDAQQVAGREGKLLVWLDPARSAEGTEPAASRGGTPPAEAERRAHAVDEQRLAGPHPAFTRSLIVLVAEVEDLAGLLSHDPRHL